MNKNEENESNRLNQLIESNKKLTYQQPVYNQTVYNQTKGNKTDDKPWEKITEGNEFDCHIQIIDLDGVEHKFSFKMESDGDFWEGGKVGNISFDLNYFTDEEDVELHHIGVYIQRLDGTYDTIFPFLRIPLKG